MKQIWRHPWVVGAINMLLVITIYTLSRIFFYWINNDLYPNVNLSHLGEMLLGGIRFDLTALLYLNSAYILLVLLPLPIHIRNNHIFQAVIKWFYWIPNAVGIVVNCMDMVYVRFTDRRTTCTIFSEFENDSNLMNIIGQSIIQYWYVTLFGITMLLVLVLLYRRMPKLKYPNSSVFYYIRETIILLLSVYFVVIGIRGGFGKYTRPLTISNALQYTNEPQETAILLNTPFSLMKSLENTTYSIPQYYTPEQLEQVMSPIHHVSKDSTGITKTNVVILLLESFSKEYIGYYNSDLDDGNYHGYTPFLDSLLQHSITYKYSFASGRKSIDAMPSVLSSIPMLIEPYIVTPYSTNAVSSLADCLNKQGYTTAFFHGAPNGSMGFQAFARSAGFQSYYGMNEYNNSQDFDGTWAIWDEDFLQFYAHTMNTMQEPFMTAIFTASSHHPFKIPSQYKDSFPQGTQPIHQCIGYTDHSLRIFFTYVQQQAWYDNTLFVITADHTNQLTYPEYTNAKGLFEVPIAFYHPQWTQGKIHTEGAVSQTDIMPSVLQYLGYNEDFFAFGEDALIQSKKHPYAICYHHPLYQIFSDSLLLQFDGKNTTAIYHHKNDPMLQMNCLAKYSEAAKPMENYLKAYIQQYITRMVNNQLTIKAVNGSTSR